MKKPLRYFVAVSVVVVVAVGSFMLGNMGKRLHDEQLNVQIAAGQAMLSFNHLQRFREFESDLDRGCSAEALEKVRISIASELNLLARFYEEHNDTWLNKYISDRDPELLTKLRTYTSPYGDSWREPKCLK